MRGTARDRVRVRVKVRIRIRRKVSIKLGLKSSVSLRAFRVAYFSNPAGTP